MVRELTDARRGFAMRDDPLLPRRLALTEVSDVIGRFYVSTVALPDGTCETLVFPGGSMDEVDSRTYSSEGQALLGHRELVGKWSTPQGRMQGRIRIRSDR
jgi:hypothetical protein